MSEFIYVLENLSMPGLVKIGRTERSVSERVNELSSHTGVPTGFTAEKEWAVADSVQAEKAIHERLADYRLSDNREFFRLELDYAIEIIEFILGTARAETQRDFEREDELIAKAIPIVVEQGVALYRVLEDVLGISYEEALFVIQALRGRGVIDERGLAIWKPSSRSFPIRLKPETAHRITEQPPAASRADPESTAEAPITIMGLTRPKPRKKPITVASTPMIGYYQLPPAEFLQYADPNLKPTESREELIANARLMQETLAQFEIPVGLGDITRGPTITRYELHPAPGVNLNEIAPLDKTLATALNASCARILTPVPGKSSVGIEVPNAIRTKVILRDLFETDEWRNSKARIPIALGKDVCGFPIIADLAAMPHLLIGGSIGSGKSIFINSIITSLLYRFSPDQLRFVMIDSSVVELQVFNTLPHLVVPVVTDPKKVVLALRWVVSEMEKRYQIFARVGVRNIVSFNARPKDKPLPEQAPELLLKARKGRVEPGEDGFAVEVDEEIVVPREDDIIIPEKLNYIVVIIDDLADLMQVAPADGAMAIARITQMGKSAGIHCVIATRRPNEKVLTNIIKANIPARVAFRCASQIDSRIVLEDETGAEKLLGKGDMFYRAPGLQSLIRAQGAFITCYEIQSIVDFIAKQAEPSYELELHRQLSKPANDFDSESRIDEDEEIIQQCIEVIRSEQQASVAIVQRRLRLGYTRAARIMEELENRGIVGSSKGAEPRDLLIDLDGDAEVMAYLAAGDDTMPVPQPPPIPPHLVVSVEDEAVIQQCIEIIRGEQKATVAVLQRHLPLGYTRGLRIMDELESRGIVGPDRGADPREVLIHLDTDVSKPLAVSPPPIPPRLVVCLCEHCGGKIEFDADELGDRQSVSVPCPHCGVETEISNPS